jgi:diaminopimelate epimerase
MTAFLKMHGLGNDFVVFDARRERLALDAASARALADRRFGIGCDQVIVIGEGRGGADAAMRIYNADGGEVESCGNATRCVARLLMEEKDVDRVAVDTPGGKLVCSDAGHGEVTVDMGAPRFGWQDVPLAYQVEDGRPFTVALYGSEHNGTEVSGVGVSVGNPHFVVPVPNADVVLAHELGSVLERHPAFPNRTNVEFISVRDRDRIRMRVFERGVGVTRACGTGACAAAVVAHRLGLTGRKVEVVLDGGMLIIDWRESDDHILMTGPATLAFKGEVDLKDYAA